MNQAPTSSPTSAGFSDTLFRGTNSIIVIAVCASFVLIACVAYRRFQQWKDRRRPSRNRRGFGGNARSGSGQHVDAMIGELDPEWVRRPGRLSAISRDIKLPSLGMTMQPANKVRKLSRDIHTKIKTKTGIGKQRRNTMEQAALVEVPCLLMLLNLLLFSISPLSLFPSKYSIFTFNLLFMFAGFGGGIG